jgi:hypothetical protein
LTLELGWNQQVWGVHLSAKCVPVVDLHREAGLADVGALGAKVRERGADGHEVILHHVVNLRGQTSHIAQFKRFFSRNTFQCDSILNVADQVKQHSIVSSTIGALISKRCFVSECLGSDKKLRTTKKP